MATLDVRPMMAKGSASLGAIVRVVEGPAPMRGLSCRRRWSWCPATRRRGHAASSTSSGRWGRRLPGRLPASGPEGTPR